MNFTLQLSIPLVAILTLAELIEKSHGEYVQVMHPDHDVDAEQTGVN